MAFQTEHIQIDGSLNVDGSIFQFNQLFTPGGGSGGGGDVAWANGSFGSNNYMITAAGDGSIVAESNLQFNGSALYVAGDISTNNGKIYLNSPGGSAANFIMKGDGEQGIRMFNTAAAGGTVSSIKWADRINNDWRWIMYTDEPADGTEDWQLRNRTAGTVLYCTSLGRVGITTETPAYNLEISGADPALGWKNTSSSDKSWRIRVVDNDFIFTESGVADRLKILAGGNIGPGIYTASNVQVDGSVYAQDGFQTGNFEIIHNTISDSLDFNYIG